MQTVHDELLEPSTIARELKRLLQKATIRNFHELVSLIFFRQTRIALRNLSSSMPKFRYVLRCLEAANRRHAKVDELLRTIAGFSCRTKEGLIKASRGLFIHPKFAV